MSKPNVLFVCIGNACRSQMAEGFARAYGGDVLEAMSAGLQPYTHVPAATRETMAEKGIDIENHFPKHISEFAEVKLDLVVNLSGQRLPAGLPEVREWPVKDPFGGSPASYRAARDRIEALVMELVLEIRRAAGGEPGSEAGPGAR